MAHELTHVVQQSGSNGSRISQNNEKCGLSPISQIVGTTTQEIARQPDMGSYPGGQGSVLDEEEASEIIKQIEPLTSEIGHGERYKVRSVLMDMRSRSRI
jgi:hypothetical protein